MSRPQDDPTLSSPNPTPRSSPSASAVLAEGQPVSEQLSPSPLSPQGVSSSSEGYPSWLPKRPPPPAPRSTFHSSSVGMYNEPGPSTEPYSIGRKPTPRSVRIVSLQNSIGGDNGRREPTDPSRTRVWSRATTAGLTATAFSPVPVQVIRPKFRTSALHTELLRHPSWKMRLWFYIFPVLVFLHIPLQTFFDFNAVFILLLVAKFPNPAAPGVPGSGRNWALGAAAYIACWVTQIFVVFLVYELVYSFIRRWRTKRPLILPIYLSSPAFNFVSMTSYTNFCFMYHIRASAFSRDRGGLRDGLAETFYYYSQNLPTVALLLPRAALSLSVLLGYSSTQPGALALADAGISHRDGTFFRASDGTLTSYARGVLIANAAWTAWRVLVLLISWMGLWILSGQGCAGLCGPRDRWEEEEAEKTVAAFNDNASGADVETLPWTWRECTVLRVQDAYEFCLTNRPLRERQVGEKKEGSELAAAETAAMPLSAMEQVFAAVGLPTGPPPARRGVLSGELFESPEPLEKGELGSVEADKGALDVSDIVPPAAAVQPREKQSAVPSGPLMKLPYPFTGYGAQVSSEKVVPFPPSPGPEEEREVPIADEEVDEEDDGDEEEEEEESGEAGSSDAPGSDDRRTSGSMSSLGRPVASRYPFQFRRPTRGRGSVSSASNNLSTPRSTQTDSTHSHSRSTQSTGNRESSDSPMSFGSSNVPSPLSSMSGSGIPMPPRHPQRRQRAGTVPVPPSSHGSPSPSSNFGRPIARTRTHSIATETSMTFGVPLPGYVPDQDPANDDSLMDVPEAEGSVEEAEQHDSVGLLVAGGISPRESLANMRRRNRSRSNSRSRTNSSTSRSESARSRAQSLIHSLGAAASRSSLDLVRSRANSMVRLSDSPYYSSDPVPSSPENNTFGHPLRTPQRPAGAAAAGPSSPRSRRAAAAAREDEDVEMSDVAALPGPPSTASAPSSRASSLGSGDVTAAQRLRDARSDISRTATATAAAAAGPSERSGRAEPERLGVPIPGRAAAVGQSQGDISTADPSFVTAPATIEGTTESSGRTPSSWGAEHGHMHVHGEAWKPA